MEGKLGTSNDHLKKRKEFLLHIGAFEKFEHVFTSHFRESKPDYHVPRVLVDHANLVHRRCDHIGQHRGHIRLLRVTQARSERTEPAWIGFRIFFC